MDNNERLQAAKVAFTLFQEKLAADYGVTPYADASSERLLGNGGITLQDKLFINFGFIAGWQPESIPSTVNSGEKKKDE